MTRHNFNKSLNVGKKGEDLFFSLFSSTLIKLDGRNADFSMPNGKTIELKSDSYDPNKTSNFFFERYSKEEKPGGPWQAFQKNIDYFIYWFPTASEIYVFDTKELVMTLELIIAEIKPKLIEIPNKTWTTRGYKINRELLKSLTIKPENIGLK